MRKQTKRPPGRPPAGDKAMMAPISIRFPTPMIEAIEAIASKRMDQPDKSAIVRELVAEALEARGKRRS